ncbi:protein of unknown function [Pararobbsia alpina]
MCSAPHDCSWSGPCHKPERVRCLRQQACSRRGERACSRPCSAQSATPERERRGARWRARSTSHTPTKESHIPQRESFCSLGIFLEVRSDTAMAKFSHSPLIKTSHLNPPNTPYCRLINPLEIAGVGEIGDAKKMNHYLTNRTRESPGNSGAIRCRP